MTKTALFTAGLLLALTASAPSQEISLVVSAGGFFPSRKVFREIYGAGVPVSFDLRAGIDRRLSVSAGMTYLRLGGTALDPDGGGEEYGLALRMISFPVTIGYELNLGEVSVRLGAGAAFLTYKEAWESLDVSTSGKKFAPVASATLEVQVSRRLSAVGTIRYMSAPVASGSALIDDTDLGGLTVMGGLAMRMSRHDR